jgi:hypothetical protein
MEKYIEQLKTKRELLEKENNLIKINLEKNTNNNNYIKNNENNLIKKIESLQRKNKRNINKEVELNVIKNKLKIN